MLRRKSSQALLFVEFAMFEGCESLVNQASTYTYASH
jgi:hypothetical protein